MLTAKDIMRERGITEKDMAKAREDTQAYIEAYNLRSARKQQHMTQTQVADAMGVSQNRVSQIETGDVDAMTVSSNPSLCRSSWWQAQSHFAACQWL